MMHRSSWGRSQGQEVVLAIRLRRAAFDEILDQAVPSTYIPVEPHNAMVKQLEKY